MSIDNRNRGLCARLTFACRESLAAFAAFGLAALSCANDATVSASLSQDGTTFTAAFSGNASETNSLWVVYDATDKGSGTNGWAHVERLGTVTPETNSWIYAAPAGWGDTVKALRFVLSEVPYDYDYSLSYVNNSANTQRIVLDDFELYANYRVCMQVRTTGTSSANNGAFFSNRAGAGNVQPNFTLFAIGKANWRFDYNETNSGYPVSGVDVNQDYSIVASSAGLYVNGNEIKTLKGTAATTQSRGSLEFFCANQTAGTMSNMGLRFNLYGAQVYNAPTGGNLLVNLVPMVKDGVAGMYDTVRAKFYFSDTGTELAAGARIESANPFFSSALVAVEEEGPTVFTPASATTDANDYDNHDGGILNGSATLTLSGANDWGGSFTVSNGTLVAAFGQGLGANDTLVLAPTSGLNGTTGGYGGWNGRATASFGSGPGQIKVAAGGSYLFTAADGGELEVDIGGEGATLPLTTDYRRFLLNGAAGAGTLTLMNPISIPANQTMIVRTGFGKAILVGDVVSATTDSTGASVSTYDLANTGLNNPGQTVFAGTANRFKTLQVLSGTCVMGDGSSTTLDGNFKVQNGACFVATNATLVMTGAAGYLSDIQVPAGTAEFRGGSATASQLIVGTSYTAAGTAPATAAVTIDGALTLDESLSENAYGSITVNGSAASTAMTLETCADVSAVNCNFYRRNIYHNGGTMALSGTYGLNAMGREGTARYWLSGGRLVATRVVQSDPTDDVASPVAIFVFDGGTLATTSYAQSPFFQNFSGSSAIQMTAKGGTFEVSKDTAITNPVVHLSGSWNYEAADYLVAPAFTKTGSATLTLSGGASTWKCATDVAEGTLALASGANAAALPATGVVRLTGGTLDLGGNAQTVKGLAGTAGSVVNGSLAATDGIYPGGAGAVGSFSCGAALSGTLYIDVDAETGACDSISVPTGSTLDLSGIDLVLPETIPEGVERLRVVTGTTTGEFNSVANLPSGWEMNYTAGYAQARKIMAFVLTIR
ncbi:MAG: autotransporter-associated beta strand repeat-containing protein [Kiritimatiellae bacterium]|nr:autotransporter-associated beta strand repeat-containing protein [Kiritimatiellia bacterium]